MRAVNRASSRVRSWGRRLLSLLEWPLTWVVRRRTMRQSARGSIDTSRPWRRRGSMVTLEVLSYLGAIALVVVVVWSLVVMLLGPGILTNLNNRCDRYSAACGAEVGFLIRSYSASVSGLAFGVWAGPQVAELMGLAAASGGVRGGTPGRVVDWRAGMVICCQVCPMCPVFLRLRSCQRCCGGQAGGPAEAYRLIAELSGQVGPVVRPGGRS